MGTQRSPSPDGARARPPARAVDRNDLPPNGIRSRRFAVNIAGLAQAFAECRRGIDSAPLWRTRKEIPDHLCNITHFVYLGQGQSLIVVGRAAPHVNTYGQALRFARDLPKNRRRTEVSVFYSGSPVPSAGILKTLKISSISQGLSAPACKGDRNV
jgi:hypothetical protein